eukprot:CAMPEP_0170491028 /NCGR_PEP_ID=MMETSP0208-20121228/10256_1 /TAXON_ID=197538 /ORGANISM="Strombidium inclinatum, Strain S3" /LENGTH=184 /DNA_ID=CAMNT_0010766531 /DNA_START=37 /DNA_END=591 /DNA_ORIENTATION=-
MKYTLAIAALLGLASIQETSAITVYSTNGMALYEESSESDSEENVQLQGDDEEVDHSNEFFPAGLHEMLGGGGYNRVLPAHFTLDSDDIFMRSMYEQYALEQKTKEGAPSGKFWMNESTTRAAAAEVLETHKGLTGPALQKYLDTYFAKAWGHFDVNRTGLVEVIKMPQLMRFLASDQYMSLQP